MTSIRPSKTDTSLSATLPTPPGIVPQSTHSTTPPVESITPYPVIALPGSTPSTRTPALPHLGEDLLVDIEVGRDLLHVVLLLERLHEPQHLPRHGPLHRHRAPGNHSQLGFLGLDAGFLE